ncbi:esterase-like activity of phytase family protein [Rubrobacter tropicus]|uniref:esterase-like activity of phytase family protein n=1 Tax=Rubrobacter tropicus TaxID=2653851 RepID=UPI00140801FD|nr:esterase-like activity of phytase family protein [Rubrobacter tropicus]
MGLYRRKVLTTGSAAVIGTAALALLLATSAALFVFQDQATAARPGAETPDCAAGVDFLGFSDALNKQAYEGTSVGGLSALAYTGRRDIYYSLVDNGPTTTSEARFYTLQIPEKDRLGKPEIVDVTTLKDASGQPFTASDFDGEGLTLTRRGDLLASSETEPSIRRFDPEGNLLEKLPVPRKFMVAPEGQAQRNQTFESLALAPNGWSLFTAVEGPLAPDGRTAEGENRIRILRYEDRGPGGFEPVEEFFYLTEPGQGVVEIVALSEDELLVLERGFQSGVGNTVRVFRVSLDGAEDVSGEPSLAAPGLEPVEKELLVDLADCPSGGATTPGTQPNPLLDNYEGLTPGPRLPGGRRAVLLQSDDNFSAGQVTRVVALGVENGRLR